MQEPSAERRRSVRAYSRTDVAHAPFKKKKRAQEQKVPVLEIEGRRNLELTLAIAANPPPAVSVA
jgi:hypothetical protein